MKILITGGAGMLGKSIRRLVGEDTDYIFATREDADLTSLSQTQALFDKIKPTHVIHLASVVGGLYMNIDRNAQMFDVNMRIHLNVMRCCNEFDIDKAILVSSTCAFPETPPQFPMTEDDIFAGNVHPTNEGYGKSKRALELMVKLYANTRTRFTILYPCNIYGIGDNLDPKTSHALIALLVKCHNAKINNTDLIVGGSGRPLRQWVNVDDVANVIIRVLNSDAHPDRMIICSDAPEISIQNLAETIAHIVGFNGKIVNDTTKSDGIFRKTVSNALMKRVMPSFQFTLLTQGIKDTYAWYLNTIYEKVGYGDSIIEQNGELEAIQLLIKRNAKIIFDVGCNVGDWTDYVKDIAPSATIHVFEPLPDMVQVINTRFKEQSRIHINQTIVSDVSQQTLSIDYYKLYPSLSGIHRRECLNHLYKEIVECRTITLDDYCSIHNINHIDYLKVDTEGHEWHVLCGADTLLASKSIDVVQFEYGNPAKDAGTTLQQIYDYLTHYGYHLYRIAPGLLIPVKVWSNNLEVYGYSNYIASTTEFNLNKKVYINVVGGLGNQLFQISAALACAWDNNLHPIISYDIEHLYKYHYDNNYRQSILSIMENNIVDRIDTSDYTMIEESIKVPPNTNIFLTTYFQDYKHFHHHRSRLIHLLTLNSPSVEAHVRRLSDSTKRNVGIQVRRTDYNGLGWSLPIQYFMNAIKLYDMNTTNFIIFSDDKDWCRAQLAPLITHLSISDIQSDIEEFFTLSKMDSIIMSNSTFGWWAAYIGDCQDVIIPSFWPSAKNDLSKFRLPNWRVV